MTPHELLKIRLANQQIISSQFNNPGEVVQWLGAMQAQDYMGSIIAARSGGYDFIPEINLNTPNLILLYSTNEYKHER